MNMALDLDVNLYFVLNSELEFKSNLILAYYLDLVWLNFESKLAVECIGKSRSNLLHKWHVSKVSTQSAKVSRDVP